MFNNFIDVILKSNDTACIRLCSQNFAVAG